MHCVLLSVLYIGTHKQIYDKWVLPVLLHIAQIARQFSHMGNTNLYNLYHRLSSFYLWVSILRNPKKHLTCNFFLLSFYDRYEYFLLAFFLWTVTASFFPASKDLIRMNLKEQVFDRQSIKTGGIVRGADYSDTYSYNLLVSSSKCFSSVSFGLLLYTMLIPFAP